jgi:hypothetical protein
MARRRLGDLVVMLAALVSVVLLYTLDSGADEGSPAPTIVPVEERPEP